MDAAEENALPSSSVAEESTLMLTPTRKIKALLAEFDDSDSDEQSTGVLSIKPTSYTSNPALGVDQSSTHESSDEDGEPPAPRGRLAARMQATATASRSNNHSESTVTSGSRKIDASDDELQEPARKRLLKRKRSASSRSGSSRRSSPRSRASTQSGPRLDVHDQIGPDELPESAHGSKFLSLVAKHRRERQEKEAEQEIKKAERLKQLKEALTGRETVGGAAALTALSDDSDLSDAAGEALTRQAPPTRKASKRALEEMHRETQRMSRGMQMAHQAQTKTRLPKAGFLTHLVSAELASHESASASQSSGSDTDANQLASSPPTSPVQAQDGSGKSDLTPQHAETAIELPELEELLARRRAKGKEKVLSVEHAAQDQTPFAQGQLDNTSGAEAESDLEIVPRPKVSHRAFSRLPKNKAIDSHQHLLLRSLANLHAPKKQPTGAVDMQTQLRLAARTQAYRERHEKLDQLRAKGVFIQTAEEREQEEQEVEDLVEQERIKAKAIQRREKQMAKKDGTFIKDELDDDSDEEDDANFESEVEEQSGSEEEESDQESEAESDKENENPILQEAEEAEDDKDSGSSAESEDDLPARPVRRRVVIMSDDEEEEPKVSPVQNKTPQSVLRSARKVIPGLMISDDLPMGLTQAFAATLADSQSQNFDSQQQDSLALTADLPSPDFRAVPALQRLESLGFVPDSQPQNTQPIDLDLLTQFQPMSPLLSRDTRRSIQPSQDLLALESQEPQSTIDTVLIATQESPLLQRTGRLQRGRFQSDDESEAEQENHAFSVMERAARRAQQAPLDKPNSNAKDAIDEVAEESEDEYAGLGGASDDEGGEENEDDRKMIDVDENLGRGDEGKLAGFYADRERQQDEAQVSKLMKDITTGALRRKRGITDDMDLSDDEDAFSRRREAKRREFARMRRELLRDEAVGKIAEDKRKSAFFQSIEDRDDVEEDTLRNLDEEMDSQSQSQLVDENSNSRPPLQLATQNNLNIPQPGTATGHFEMPAQKPASLAQIRQQVSFLIEERDSQPIDPASTTTSPAHVAFLDMERHLAQANADEAALDSEDEGLGGFIVNDEQDDASNENSISDSFSRANPRRSFQPNIRDRLTFLRSSSSSLSVLAEQAATAPVIAAASKSTAFFAAAATAKTVGEFKVPALSRQGTTDSVRSEVSLGLDVGERAVASGKSVVELANGTERGGVDSDGNLTRKAGGGRRNAVNFARQAGATARVSERSSRAPVGLSTGTAAMANEKGKKESGGFLRGLFRSETWH